MIIHKLPPHLSNLIAAGEVVERPASAAKEMMENAIDAGASAVTVEILNGGVSYLRVTDNGSGMDREDAKTAFLRHATSKIHKEEDLVSIATMGFRGEALAAIGAVSRISLTTKREEDESGSCITIDAGEIIGTADCAAPTGSTLIVRDLFYNTPARMKFLKKDFTEAGYVTAAAVRCALANPHIAFRFIKEGKEIFSTTGDGKLENAIYLALGKDYAEDLIEMPPKKEGLIRVSGFTSPPHMPKSNRSGQIFFVNERFVRAGILSAAVETAYRNRIIGGKYPYGVYHISLPYHLVDVNVHPAKTEVKFVNEKQLFDSLYSAVKTAIEGAENIPTFAVKPPREDNISQMQTQLTQSTTAMDATYLDKKPEMAPHTTQATRDALAIDDTQAAQEGQSTATATLSWPPAPTQALGHAAQPSGLAMPPLGHRGRPPLVGENPISRFQGFAVAAELETPMILAQNTTMPPLRRSGTGTMGQYLPVIEADADFDKTPDEQGEGLHFPPENPQSQGQNQSAQGNLAPPLPLEAQPAVEDFLYLGQCFSTYILAQTTQGLYLIDKHAAHERMIFNRLLSQNHGENRQILLSPVVCRFSPSEFSILHNDMAELDALGFTLEPFGENAMIVRELPLYLDPDEAEETLSQLAQDGGRGQKTLEEKLHTVACKAAIRGGDKTSETEQIQIAKRVLSDKSLRACPHGRPTAVLLTRYEIEKMFKRANQ